MEKIIRSVFSFWGILYAAVAVALFLFSFTQVDLSLTLSSSSIAQTVQKSFQFVGYYQRPWATVWYIGILAGYFALYAGVLHAAARKQISANSLWGAVAITTLVLVFSYPAFSYDMFNYMFTAK